MDDGRRSGPTAQREAYPDDATAQPLRRGQKTSKLRWVKGPNGWYQTSAPKPSAAECRMSIEDILARLPK